MAPRETENNAYAKFWGDKQRTLWYVMVFLEWSITGGNLITRHKFTYAAWRKRESQSLYSFYDDLVFDSCLVEVDRWYHLWFVQHLYGYFCTGPVFSYQKSKILQAMYATDATTSAIGLEYSNTPRIPYNE